MNMVAPAAALVCLGFGAETSGRIRKYQAYLSPMPHNDATHANFSGKGATVATLDGDTLSLSGTFTGLASAATKAHICLSMAAGIPGRPIFEVIVPAAVEGNVTGTFKLDKDQIDALQKGQLYIQIDSEKASNGNLWGWLLAGHEIAGQDVPQKGPWFLPEVSIKTK
ncbi:MAG TPA: CHRD domain-containing protein [Bryobacteraceae bacterium]|nr:CHRD domain-containing protein [Bryobacteraceae bacterium]